MLRSIIFIIFVLIGAELANAKTVRYELNITRERVNLSGKKDVDFALMVNKSIPAPTLEFTEGDDAEILVTNGLSNEEVSIHWHGILLPPREDGVAYVNTPPIHPGQSRLFKFRIRQSGTYWYHSHTMLQEQKGVYGAFIIHPKKASVKVDHDVVVVLSDWTDENPDQVLKNLRKDGDYYLYKKNSIRSIFGAIKAKKLKTYFKNELDRMGGMDLSDVGYDAFLINGQKDSQLMHAKAGDTVRLRVINAAASSYFYVSLAGLPFKIISADGVDIAPIKTKEILMGMAETYDLLFKLPENKNYELRATVQDVTGYASAYIGHGDKVKAPSKEPVDLYTPMDHAGHHDMDHAHGHHHHMHHGHHHTEPEVESLTVDDVQAQESTAFSPQNKVTELKLVLGGDMERYIWHINGKAIHEDRDILINEGDVVRFTFVNETMMHHPMHLHGHFFRVLNQHGDHSPLKHTVDVPPHGERTIEFIANERGQWMLHCHNLYHMKTGMARVVKYMSYQPAPDIAALEKQDPHLHDHIYTMGLIEGASNHAKAEFKVMRTWDQLELEVETRYEGQHEGDLLYRRYFGNFLSLAVGGTTFAQHGYGMIGVGYVLPLLIEANIYVNHDGDFRLDLEKHLRWTSHVFSDIEYTWRPKWMGDEESEFEITLMYGPKWHWAAGLMFTEDSVGAGAWWRF